MSSCGLSQHTFPGQQNWSPGQSRAVSQASDESGQWETTAKTAKMLLKLHVGYYTVFHKKKILPIKKTVVVVIVILIAEDLWKTA